MNSRSRMRMRATVQRDSNVGNDYGDSGVPSWMTNLSALPCHVWNRAATSRAGSERFSEEVPISDYYPVMICPLGSDIVETDRVFEVKDLRGFQKFGQMEIVAILGRADHLEVRMRDHA